MGAENNYCKLLAHAFWKERKRRIWHCDGTTKLAHHMFCSTTYNSQTLLKLLTLLSKPANQPQHFLSLSFYAMQLLDMLWKPANQPHHMLLFELLCHAAPNCVHTAYSQFLQ